MSTYRHWQMGKSPAAASVVAAASSCCVCSVLVAVPTSSLSPLAPLQVQLGSSVAVVRDGELVSEVDVAPSVPRLVLAHPPALLVGGEAEPRQLGIDDTACEEEGVCQGSGCCGAAAARGRRAGLVTLIGRNIADSHDVVICTQNGGLGPQGGGWRGGCSGAGRMGA